MTAGRWRPLFMTRLGIPFNAVALVTALTTLWAVSAPGGPTMGAYIGLYLLWLALGAIWLFRVVAALLAGGYQRLASHWGWWVGPPVSRS